MTRRDFIRTGNGVRVMLLTDKSMMEQVLEYIIQVNTAQMREPAFATELKYWIRFSESDAVRLRFAQSVPGSHLL